MVCKIFWKQMVRDPTLHFIWRMSKQTLLSHIMLGIISMLTQQEDCHQLSHQDHFLQLLCGPWGIQLLSSTDLVWPQRVWGAQHKETSMWAALWGAPSFTLSYTVPVQWVKGNEEKEAQWVSPCMEITFVKIILQHPVQTCLSSSSVVVQCMGRVQNPWQADLMEWAMWMHSQKQQENSQKLSILCSLYIPHLLQSDGRLF